MKNRISNFFHIFFAIIHQAPGLRDIVFLFGFTILVTFHPYFLWEEIKLSEMGLYLPGALDILKGAIPFRDVFHLRGPFELYMPAVMLKLFGTNLSVLNSYFYFGTIFTLLLGILIGKELYRTRYVLYLMTLIFVARTFPRIFYKDWGGMRYAWGFLAMLCAIRFFKTGRLSAIFFTGIFTACGFFTSTEIGIFSALGTLGGLFFAYLLKSYEPRFILRALGVYVAGVAVIGVPYFVYLWQAGALTSYLDVIWTIPANFPKTFRQDTIDVYPTSFQEIILAMINPGSKNFRHLTPAYMYIFLFGYLIYRLRSHRIDKVDLGVISFGVYGFLMYITSFRSLWGPQFEMALQPDKILFFFLLERFYFVLRDRKNQLLNELGGSSAWRKDAPFTVLKLYGIFFLFSGFLGSSIGFSIARYNSRFYAFQFVGNLVTGKDTAELSPMAKTPTQALSFERAKGMGAPAEQAQDIEAVVSVLQEKSSPKDTVVGYPHMGIYNFFLDRPFVSRFSSVNLSWFSERWHREVINEFKKTPPAFIIIPDFTTLEYDQFFKDNESNQRKHAEFMQLLEEKYVPMAKTPKSSIYRLKNHAPQG